MGNFFGVSLVFIGSSSPMILRPKNFYGCTRVNPMKFVRSETERGINYQYHYHYHYHQSLSSGSHCLTLSLTLSLSLWSQGRSTKSKTKSKTYCKFHSSLTKHKRTGPGWDRGKSSLNVASKASKFHFHSSSKMFTFQFPLPNPTPLSLLQLSCTRSSVALAVPIIPLFTSIQVAHYSSFLACFDIKSKIFSEANDFV